MRAKLSRVKDLPTLPPVVFKIKEAVSDEDSSVDSIAEIIAGDQSLSSSILRVANSVYYSSAGKSVGSISEAIVRLGMDGVRELCTTIAIIKEFKKICRHIDFRQFWRHSIATAHAAGIILEYSAISEYEKDQAYTAGLIHDVGLLILTSFFMGTAVEVWKRAAEKEIAFYVAEKEELRIHHGEICGYLLEKWNIPSTVVSAVTNHHGPGEEHIGHPGLAAVVELAESMQLSAEFIEPFHGQAGEIRGDVLAQLDIGRDDLDEIEEHALTEAEKTEDLLMIGEKAKEKIT